MKHHAFLACHPAVNLLYFVLVLTFSMFFLHPLCLAVSLCAALWCAAGYRPLRFASSCMPAWGCRSATSV